MKLTTSGTESTSEEFFMKKPGENDKDERAADHYSGREAPRIDF